MLKYMMAFIIDSASTSQLWAYLTVDEKRDFLKKVEDPLASAHLNRMALDDTPLPWWCKESETSLDASVSVPQRRQRGKAPDPIQIPRTLIRTSAAVSDPARVPVPLIYNTVYIWSVDGNFPGSSADPQISLAYALVTRLTWSPLRSLNTGDGADQDTSSDRNLAVQILRRLLPFLFERGSRKLYINIQSVLLDIWQNYPKVV